MRDKDRIDKGRVLMTSKTSEVLRRLQEDGSITSMEAIESFGATRLSAIIFNLRHVYGHDIETVNMQTTDRYGHVVTYAKYVLHEEKPLTLFEVEGL